MKMLHLLTLSAATLAAAASPAMTADSRHAPRPLLLAQNMPFDLRPSEQLSVPELRQRVQLLRQLAESGQQVIGLPASIMLQADLAELQRRGASETAPVRRPLSEIPQPAPGQPQASDPRVTQPQPLQPSDPRVVRPQPLQPAQPSDPRVVQPPQRRQPPQASDPRVTPPQQPRPLPPTPPADTADLPDLPDRRAASLLTDAELRRRIRVINEFLKTAPEQRRHQGLRAIMEADRAELKLRIAATTGVDVEDADREARAILRERRPPEGLSDKQLRERIRVTRGVLAMEGLDRGLEQQLRQLLAGDREEIRLRVAEDEPVRRPERPRREADGDDLRRDLLRAREERRRRLEDPSYRIRIPREAVVGQPLPTIPLAEAYEEDLQRQLSAPPRRHIDRRYTIEEYRALPSLRTVMPGIEVDTVKFGFNEDFLRVDEVIKLDRIGAIMERIIAGNPDEVFLIEGHTDLVGSDAYNQALSYRRAAAVRDALAEYYYIPRRNLEIVGYGEQFPRIPTEFEEPENRRVTVRRITPILYGSR
ncbi:MAG: hypothetical protein BroJett030_06970 [Alphaproteobacteria bacterium]|nr:MAG: hypothetical protein BroJett030_06970 [Alphaproteobacteria bacterium]